MSLFDKILAVLRASLPIGAGIASLFIHNKDSQHELMVVVSDVDTISQLAGALVPTAAPVAPAA